MPERSDLSLRGLAIGAAIIVAGIAASLTASFVVIRNVDVPLTGPTPPKVEGPALQTAPPQDLAAFLREKQARLEGSGPVDRDHVHIPIERAMQMLSQRRSR